MKKLIAIAAALAASCGGPDCTPGCEYHGNGWFECSGGELPPWPGNNCTLNGNDARACGASWFCWVPGPK
jgi:hypothetical protein